jgi:DnaJ-class molecular chaperone
MRDLYDALGIDNDADDSQLKIAYRKAALRWHPGEGGTETED